MYIKYTFKHFPLKKNRKTKPKYKFNFKRGEISLIGKITSCGDGGFWFKSKISP